jgi:hypothetical protein
MTNSYSYPLVTSDTPVRPATAALSEFSKS